MSGARRRGFVRLAMGLPVLLAAALLAVAFQLGDLQRVIGNLHRLDWPVLALALLAGGAYLAGKLWQLRLLLADLGIRPGWRTLLFAFAAGELAVTLPLGIFVQNWVLSAVRSRADFGRSAAATTVMLLVEMWVALLLLAVVGIPRWPVLQPLAALCACGLVGFVVVVMRRGGRRLRTGRRLVRPGLRRTMVGVLLFLRACRRLSGLRVLLFNTLLAAVYLGMLIAAMTWLGRSVGITALEYRVAATVYAFSLVVVLFGGGLLSQVGTLEVVGMGAAQAWGLSLTEGLALMLTFRIVWTGVMWLLNLPVLLLLWRRVAPRSADEVDETPD